MKIAIVLNKCRAPETLISKLNTNELSQIYNINYDLFLVEPKDIKDVLEKLNLKTYNACVIGGGDGTVRTAAELFINSDVPLAFLPLGTFNVLSKTLGYPHDIDKVFQLITNNKTKTIDLAEVNQSIFINHAWIGFYYYILKMREKHKNFLGRSKFLKMLFNAIYMLRELPVYDLTLKISNHIHKYHTCLVFISNNESYTNFLDFGARKSLSTGLLHVSILKCNNRWQLILCILKTLFFPSKDSKYISSFIADEAVIAAKNDKTEVVLDGELFKLSSPLYFKNHQKKLKVLIP